MDLTYAGGDYRRDAIKRTEKFFAAVEVWRGASNTQAGALLTTP